VEWEPQYNLTPVTFGDTQLVQNTRQADTAKNKAKAAIPPPEKKAEDALKQRSEKTEQKQLQKDLPPSTPRPEPPNKND
jgi:hypothetical protein